MPPVLPYSLSFLALLSGLSTGLFPMPLTLLQLKAGMNWSKVKCSRFQSASQTQGACPQLPDYDPSPERPWTTDTYTPLSNDRTAQGTRSKVSAQQASRPSAGVHRMGTLKGSFICFQKPHFDLYFDTSVCLSPFPLICIYPDHPVHMNEKWGQGIAKD